MLLVALLRRALVSVVAMVCFFTTGGGFAGTAMVARVGAPISQESYQSGTGADLQTDQAGEDRRPCLVKETVKQALHAG